MNTTLIISAALGVVEVFTGITVIMNSGNDNTGLFTFLTMIIGYILIVLDLKEKDKLEKAKEVCYQGYEKLLLVLSVIVLLVCDLLIYCGVVGYISITSPVIMISWIIPLVTLLAYQSLVVFFNKEVRIENTLVRYKDIKNVVLASHKKKIQLTMKTKSKDFVFIGKQKQVDNIVNYLKEKNIEVK